MTSRNKQNFYRVALFFLPDGTEVLVAKDRNGHCVEVRGVYDGPDSDPLRQVIDALPGNLVGGELMSGSIALVDSRSYTKALPVIEALFKED